MIRSFRTVSILLLTICSLAMVGCESPREFTPEEFQKVKAGMSEAEVRSILGKPFDSFDFMGNMTMWWRVKDKYYHVEIEEGKVEEMEGPVEKQEYDEFREAVKLLDQLR